MQGIGALLCLVLFVGFSFASNVLVNTTLSDAIAQAIDGDVIIIPSNIYTGDGNTNLTLYGRNLTFQSESGNFNDVTIDCGGQNVSAVAVYYQPTPLNYSGEPLPAGNATTALSFFGITFANCASALFLNATNTTGNNTIWIGSSNFIGNVGYLYGTRSVGYGGGAIYSEGPVDLTINNTTFTNCTGDVGGAIFGVYGSTINITTSSFTNNTASDAGGAITIAYRTSLEISSSVFQDNTADFGGAIYTYYSTFSTITTSNFTSNKGNNYGGGVNADTSATHIIGCSFTSNVANIGGAVCSISIHGAAIVENSNFWNNLGYTAGGALAAINDASLFLTDSTIAHNLAYAGGAVTSMTSGYAVLTGVMAHDNNAKQGGAFYISDKSTIIVQSSQIQNNTAAIDGDTLFCQGSFMTFNATSITVPSSNPSAEQNGVYCTVLPGDNTWCTVRAYESGDWSQVCANAPGSGIKKKMPGWEIAVIVIGVVIGALAIGFLVAYAISTKFEAPSRAQKLRSDTI
eukprot:Phypoly_transcript_06915.p1 GENE.Phypoly_transcript_06915~~Phypoly_transcript_06915.p1  ORF type:complete len:516 (+),score=73.30 Phypoly_transcript_06915:51-1598(+)